MSKVNQLMRDQAEQAVTASIDAANQWLDVARPIIAEYLALDRSNDRLAQVEIGKDDHSRRYTIAEARSIISKAYDRLYAVIFDLREEFVGDNTIDTTKMPAEDEVAWDAAEEHDDELRREVIGVDAAIRLVERELVGRLAA